MEYVKIILRIYYFIILYYYIFIYIYIGSHLGNVCDLIENKFLEYLKLGYGHADEQLYSPVYFQNPELFDHHYGDYQQMITNYTYVYENSFPPIHNFIRNSFNNMNYKKCYKSCKFIFNSYYLNKC
jgi:hypothetical protein